MGFFGELQANFKRGQRSGKLGIGLRDLSFGLLGRAEDGVVIDVISRGTSDRLHGGADAAEVMPGRVPGNQPGIDDSPGMIVNRQNQDILSPREREPRMNGAVVLEQ